MTLQHDTILSERTVHRILRSQGLYRRQNQSGLPDVVEAILLSVTGQNVGYSQMRQILLVHHGIVATCETVRLALSVIDPSGVMLRQSKTLRRRVYRNAGPNFAIHFDGWDKLKPYGVSVHGGIDGFSRRLLWLKCCNSNKKPQYIGHFYLEYVEEIQGLPLRVYADRGTENVIVRDIQHALHFMDPHQYLGYSNFVYVSSTRNVRIERFWRTLRDMCGNTWMNFFKDMCDMGILDTTDNLHLECVRYCYFTLIRKDLNDVMSVWNSHRVRQCRFAESPAGKPDVLFYQPELYGASDFKVPLANGLQEVRERFCENPSQNGASEEFLILARNVLTEFDMEYPARNRLEATEMFIAITAYADCL
jgi:hypothetical protein